MLTKGTVEKMMIEKRECPECGNRTHSQVCAVCGHRTLPDPDMTEKTQTQPGRYEYSLQHYGGKYVRKKLAPVWVFLVSLFVLIPLLTVGAQELYQNDSFRYIKAGSGEARRQPKVASSRMYRGNGVTVKLKSFGILDGEQALALTVTNRSGKDDVEFWIDSLTINGQPISRFKSWYRLKKGKTTRIYLTLDSQELADRNIGIVEELSMVWRVCENVFKSPDLVVVDSMATHVKTSAYRHH